MELPADAAHRPLLAPRASTSCRTSRASSRACARGTAPSCSPTSPDSARRPSRCSRPRSPNAYPMLAVVPNVVKINWAREVERWTPQRRVSVIHGDGDDVDAFADVFVVNYEILDRHLVVAVVVRLPLDGGRRGALHQEPHLAALAARAGPRRQSAGDDAGRRPAAARAHRHAAHQRRRGLRRHLAVPRLGQGRQAGRRDRPPAREPSGSLAGRPRLLPGGAPRRHRHGHRAPPQGRRRERPAREAHRRHPRRARRRLSAGPIRRGERAVGAARSPSGMPPC